MPCYLGFTICIIIITNYNTRERTPLPTHLCLDNVMDPIQLQLRFAKIKTDKATADPIPPLVYQKLAPTLAQLYHPLYTKIATRATEPICYKGILAHPRPKKEGHGITMDHYRCIGIRSLHLKTYHAFLRDKLKKAITHIIHSSHSSQCGGVTKRSTTMAATHLRWTADLATVFHNSPANFVCRH